MERISRKFKELSIKHEEAIQTGNNKTANRLHKELMSLYYDIKNNEDFIIIKELSKDKNESVRLWAATFLLKSNSEFALKLLNDLKKSNSVNSLTASAIIDMWAKGMLQL